MKVSVTLLIEIPDEDLQHLPGMESAEPKRSEYREAIKGYTLRSVEGSAWLDECDGKVTLK